MGTQVWEPTQARCWLLQRPVWLRARGGSERSAAPRCWAGLPADVFAIICEEALVFPQCESEAVGGA